MEWIKKHRIITIVCFVILVSMPPIIINRLYMNGSSTPNTTFTSDNLLLYIGSILSFFGMIVLGGLTWFQNKRFKNENDESQNKLNNAIEKLEEANGIIADANTKQTAISAELIKMRKDQEKPILYFMNGNISYLSSATVTNTTLTLKFNIEHAKSICTEYLQPIFFLNEREYHDHINIISHVPTNLYSPGDTRNLYPISANDTFTLNFKYDGLRFETLEKIVEIEIYTTDLYDIKRKNVFAFKIESIDLFNLISCKSQVSD